MGETSAFGSRRARTLLAILATSPRPVHRNVLIERLWPEDPADAARPRLRTEIHRLREALGEHAEIVVADRDTVSLDREQAAIDLERIAALLADGQPGEAVELFRGPLLPHETDEEHRALRSQWDDTFRETIEAAAERALDQGYPDRSLALARRGLSLLSDRPGLIRLVMASLVALRDVPEALAVYDRYVDRLEAEADLAPDRTLAEYAATLRPGKALRTEPAPVAANLPARTAKIFGREETLAGLERRLLGEEDDSAALFTLLGPGGVGKTTVALEVARRLEEKFLGRVFFIPLASVLDAAHLGTAVAHALEVGGSAEDDLSAIATRLKGGPVLLVLDNFEQLAPAGSRWVAELSQRLPAARLLVTSRRPLGLSIERRVPLPPLPTANPESPAVSLFIDRARRIGPDYNPGPGERADIARLAEWLEGLPLGLVLAAARVDAFTPEQMLQDIAAPEAVAEHEDVDRRHHSLALAIDWSLDLLPTDHLTFLSRLTVFPRNWPMDAATRVAGPEAATLLPSLVDQSLLLVSPSPSGPRYRMLQVIREHLLRLRGEPSDELRDRHGRFYAELVESAFATQKEDIHRNIQVLQPEIENIYAALEWLRGRDREVYYRMLVGLTGFWAFRQNERRGVEWLLEATREVEGRGDAVHADLNLCAFRLLLAAGRYDEARAHCDVAQAFYEAAGDRSALMITLRYRSHLAYYQADFRQMVIDCEATLAVAEEVQDSLFIALALSDLALPQTNLGEGEAALRSLSKAMAIQEARNDVLRLLALKQSYAATLLSMRRWHEAERVLLDILERNRETKHDVIDIQCHTHLTTVCLRTGRIEEAEAHLTFARDPNRGSFYAFLQGVRHYLGVLLGVAKADRRETEQSARDLFQAWSSMSNSPSILPAADILAFALASFGHLEAGKRLLDQGEALRRRHDVPLSPHYSLTYEEARALVGPYEPVEAPESYVDLSRDAQRSIWFL